MAIETDTESVTTIIKGILEYYDMATPELLTDVSKAIGLRLLTENSTIDDIGIQLRDSKAFKERFSGNEKLRAAKKPVYSVSQYLQLESQYRSNLLAAGMPADFYSSQADIANFIGNQNSPDEIKDRVALGYAAVKNADPKIVAELKTLYGLDDGTLAAFFFRPSTNQRRSC